MSTTTAEGRPQLAGMKYLVESILSTDATGTVMLISDQNALGTRYALKVIKREGPDDDVHLAVAQAHAEASAKLGHPGILKYHDFRLQRKWFRVSRGELLMEYLRGRSLDALTELSLDQLILIFAKAAAALAHMHRREVRHGDLRPEHLLIGQTGEVKLMGYGLSLVPAALKEQLRGSKRYMAPEQIRGRVLGEKVDVYALGAVMYHQMTGQPANVGGRAKGEAQKIPLPTRLNPAIEAPLNNLLVACLQSDPPKRPESMYEVSQRLDAIVQARGLEDEILKGAAPAAS